MSWLEEMLARQSRIAGGDGQAERLRQRLQEAAAVRGSGTEDPRAAPSEQRKSARGLLARLAARAGPGGSALPRAAGEARAGSAAEPTLPRLPDRAEESVTEEGSAPEPEKDAADVILQNLPRQPAASELPQAQTQAVLVQMERRLRRAAAATAPLPRAQTLAADGPQSMSQCGAAEAAALSRLYERDARRYDGGFEFPL